MSADDVSPNEMHTPDDFDDAAAEALLSGQGREVDARLADLVGDMRVAYTSIPPALGAELSALIDSAAPAPAIVSAHSRRFERMRSSKIAKVGVAFAAMFAATSGLAVANALPAPVQDAASHLGIGAPAGHDDTATTADEETTTTIESPTTTEPDDTKAPAAPTPTTAAHDNHGSDVSTVAHDNNVSGCEHGAAVSKVASDGRSHNDGSCDTSTSVAGGTPPATPDDHPGDDTQGDQHATDGHGHDGTSPTTVDGHSSDSGGGS
jgi:hypothetical protein